MAPLQARVRELQAQNEQLAPLRPRVAELQAQVRGCISCEMLRGVLGNQPLNKAKAF